MLKTMVAPWREYQTQVKLMILSHDYHYRYNGSTMERIPNSGEAYDPVS
jgi:hypothetical protein